MLCFIKLGVEKTFVVIPREGGVRMSSSKCLVVVLVVLAGICLFHKASSHSPSPALSEAERVSLAITRQGNFLTNRWMRSEGERYCFKARVVEVRPIGGSVYQVKVLREGNLDAILALSGVEHKKGSLVTVSMYSYQNNNISPTGLIHLVE